MICMILAAGYATRLYPLTENFPKPLLTVKGKTILDWLIDDIEQSGKIDEYIVISNHKFAEHFKKWCESRNEKIIVVDDMTETNDTRLGAVKDIQFAIETLKLNDDMLIIAGDNLLDFTLTTFIDYAQLKNASCVMRYYEPSSQKLTKSGVISVDKDDRIINMEEKPTQPKSHWCCPPFYYYAKADAKLVKTAIENGCATDAPGSFISWLCKNSSVYAMEMQGRRYDIGNLESYKKVQEEYNGVV